MLTRSTFLASLAVLCLASSAAASRSTSATTSLSAGSLVWGTPKTVDAGQQILSLACQPRFGCLSGDDNGAVFAQATGSSRWQRIFLDEGEQITTLACVSATRCLALDGYPGDSGGFFGKIVSINPATRRSATEHIRVRAPGPDNFNGVDGLACAGTTCTITTEDRAGTAVAPTLRSTRPWLATSWKPIPRSQALPGTTCPTATTCLGPLGRSIAIYSVTGTRIRRRIVKIDAPGYVKDVSCSSVTFCVAVDESGDALPSNSPAIANSWVPTGIADTGLESVACVPRECLAGTEDGAIVTGTFGAPAQSPGPAGPTGQFEPGGITGAMRLSPPVLNSMSKHQPAR
jgi:hypothetical protein